MEKAILVGLITPNVTQDQSDEYLEELAFLAKTAGVKPIKIFTQRLQKADNKTFLGKGKILEVLNYANENKIQLIIFDDDLSPSNYPPVTKIWFYLYQQVPLFLPQCQTILLFLPE